MSKAKVFLVNAEHKSDYNVYFVDQPHKEKNHAIIKDGTLVRAEHQADVKLFIVDAEHKADICITQKNFPKAA